MDSDHDCQMNDAVEEEKRPSGAVEDLANQMSDMKIGEKMEISCPVCGRLLKSNKGMYTCRPWCYMGQFPGPREYVEYLQNRLDGLKKEHEERHSCEGDFTIVLDNGNENILFAECVECGYLNYMRVIELLTLGAKEQ